MKLSIFAATLAFTTSFISATAEACSGTTRGTRCGPPRTEVQTETQPEAAPKHDMTKKTGRASAQRQSYQSDVINLNVIGNAAELIYKDLQPKAIYETEFEGGVIQIVGPNMTCYEQTKKQRSGAVKKSYSCDINIKEGATLSGAAG